jgi:hypothetical protein
LPAKASLPSAEALTSVFYLALDKAFFPRVPEKKQSAKPPALGKEADSGSVGLFLENIRC